MRGWRVSTRDNSASSTLLLIVTRWFLPRDDFPIETSSFHRSWRYKAVCATGRRDTAYRLNVPFYVTSKLRHIVGKCLAVIPTISRIHPSYPWESSHARAKERRQTRRLVAVSSSSWSSSCLLERFAREETWTNDSNNRERGHNAPLSSRVLITAP